MSTDTPAFLCRLIKDPVTKKLTIGCQPTTIIQDSKRGADCPEGHEMKVRVCPDNPKKYCGRCFPLGEEDDQPQ